MDKFRLGAKSHYDEYQYKIKTSRKVRPEDLGPAYGPYSSYCDSDSLVRHWAFKEEVGRDLLAETFSEEVI